MRVVCPFFLDDVVDYMFTFKNTNSQPIRSLDRTYLSNSIV